MAVDLSDLVDALTSSINPPGENLYPDATTSDFVGYLSNAFWEAKLSGMLDSFTELDGIVTPLSGTTDLSREEQRLVVTFAAFNIILNTLRNTDTTFRAHGGPAEFETQKSAQLLRDILAELRHKLNIIMDRLSDLGRPTDLLVDAVNARTDSLAYGDTYWIR